MALSTVGFAAMFHCEFAKKIRNANFEASGVFAIVEKPLTGYFGDGSEDFNGDTFAKTDALDHALASIERMSAAEAISTIYSAYASSIQV